MILLNIVLLVLALEVGLVVLGLQIREFAGVFFADRIGVARG
jgi:hypothetical protein